MLEAEKPKIGELARKSSPTKQLRDLKRKVPKQLELKYSSERYSISKTEVATPRVKSSRGPAKLLIPVLKFTNSSRPSKQPTPVKAEAKLSWDSKKCNENKPPNEQLNRQKSISCFQSE